MSDENPNFAHSTDPEKRWLPCHAETLEEAAIDAAYEWDHDFIGEVGHVLVGEPDHWGERRVAELIDGDTIVELLDERRLDNIFLEIDRIATHTTDKQRLNLEKRIQEVLCSWLKATDISGRFFTVHDWVEFEVTKFANEPGGPKVNRVEEAT